MRDFRIERKEKKADRRKLTARIRRLTRYMLWHYLSLSLSGFIGALALFAFLNTDVPWKGAMLALDCASLVLVLWLLFSGLERK